MNYVLSPFLNRFLLVFLHDILIYSKSYKMHLEDLRKILEVSQQLIEKQFHCKRSKCMFFAQHVQYLGQLLTLEGLQLQLDPRK